MPSGVADGIHIPTTAEIFTKKANLRVLVNVVPLLTLGIMGGAILPVPSAFATTGIIASTVSMIIIAACMVYTCDLLLWQSYFIGTRDYETLAQAIGGRWYRIFTEVWLIILLIGTMLGSIVQIGEVVASGITFVSANPPAALVNGSGRVCMVIAVILLIPFVFLKTLRGLEYFGDFGVSVVFAMVIVIMIHSIQMGLPAIGNGFAIAGFDNLDNFGAAISTYGFMFYIQPVMMPILDEMPKGIAGVKLLSWGARLAICGTAFSMYYLAGFFGAAAFGQDTEGDILENNLGGNGKGQGALNFLMSAYMALGLVPFEWSARHACDSLLILLFPQLNVPKWVLPRKIAEAFFVYGLSLGLALAIPGTSSTVISITGATGVLFVCYLIPIINHYMIIFERACFQKDPSILEGISKAVKKEVLEHKLPESLPDDSVHSKISDVSTDSSDSQNELGWNPPVVKERGVEYSYKTGGAFLQMFHICLPIIVFAVGAFASALTLKGL